MFTVKKYKLHNTMQKKNVYRHSKQNKQAGQSTGHQLIKHNNYSNRTVVVHRTYSAYAQRMRAYYTAHAIIPRSYSRLLVWMYLYYVCMYAVIMHVCMTVLERVKTKFSVSIMLLSNLCPIMLLKVGINS